MIKLKPLPSLLVELNQLKGIYEQNAMHNHDEVFKHIINVFKQVKKLSNKAQQPELLLWVALLHDIAKKETFKDYGKQTACLGHEKLGVIKARKILTRLEFLPEQKNYILQLIRWHGEPHQIFVTNGQNKKMISSAFRKFKQQHPKIFTDAIILALADTRATQYREKNPVDFAFRVKTLKSFLSAGR